MLFVVKQQKLTRNVVTCDEAGAFGFNLHRRFEELGVQPVVLHPFAAFIPVLGLYHVVLDAEFLQPTVQMEPERTRSSQVTTLPVSFCCLTTKSMSSS